MKNVPQRDILGIEVVALKWKPALELVAQNIHDGIFTRVAWLNAHCANVAQADVDYRQALRSFLILPDGIGVDIASRILHGSSFPDNLNGTDFVPALLASIKEPLRVGLWGAKPDEVALACAKFKKQTPQHDLQVISHGFFTSLEEPVILEKLAQFRPHILLVAMGVPRQEIFISHKITGEHCTAVFGVGALFDFQAGGVKRAPEWIRKTRMEWVYRLLQEPQRLWRRYLVGNPLFLWHLLKYRLWARKK
ncbi:WecB/TagA/CpsF family glycosyltransferase [Paenochrobactrum sp. BZR 588]|uniref:WecB/TagA/CpsF family glycosyltransferase n=1 Tax=unclassified Paenochrobactrum TaxID=2639760 RepID=UPI0038555111